MSAGAKFLIAVGAVGTVAGVGYAIVNHRRQRSSESENAGDTKDETTAEPKPEEANSKPAPSKIARIVNKPLPGLSLPLSEATHPQLNVRINASTNIDGVVQESPTALLVQAMRHDPAIDLDELAGARLVASEHGSGTFTELACMVDTEMNRAASRGRSLFTSLTRGHTFGKQGGKRPASTRLDPKMRHLLAARAVISGAARGVSYGATRFFDPRAMESMHRRYRKWVDGGRIGKKPSIVSCDAITLLEAWSFDYGKKGKSRCPPDRTKKGRHPLAWVGPIPGVDPLRLFLMKPMQTGIEHSHRFEAARALLRTGLRTDGKAG